MAPRSLASYLPAPVLAADPKQPPPPPKPKLPAPKAVATASTSKASKAPGAKSQSKSKGKADVVSNLIRASYGSAAKYVPDDGLDQFVTDMLLREAKVAEEKRRNAVDGYKMYGIGNTESSGEAPRLQKRFLSAVIKGVQEHNEDLKAKEEEKERQKKKALREKERELREREWDRGKRREEERYSRDGRERERRRDGSRDRSDSHKRRREEEEDSRSSKRKRHGSVDERSRDEEKGMAKERDLRKSRRDDSDEEGHRFSRRRRSDDEDNSSRTKSRRHADEKEEDKLSKRRKHHDSGGEDSGSPTSIDRARRKREKKEKRLRSGEGYNTPDLPSKMDKYFSSSYDPRLDINLDDLTDPTTGFVAEGAYATWDNMLELLKIRKEEKAEKKWKDKMGVASSSGGDMMRAKYPKKGETREWDVGKDMSF
ncbi:hypothetical protein BT69DRAFT_1285144 [Atractiella rhizophila]|nr:hypothetical protein BT69DRAFT_1285144 [Atractiella rhizophila]